MACTSSTIQIVGRAFDMERSKATCAPASAWASTAGPGSPVIRCVISSARTGASPAARPSSEASADSSSSEENRRPIASAIEAGREAFLAGRMPAKRYASASSPVDGLFFS